MSNPFTPGFGRPPEVLAGRGREISDFEEALSGDLPGDLNVLITGARGTGKTVLLTEFEAIALDAGWVAIALHTASNSLVTELRSEVVAHLREVDPEATTSRLASAGISGFSAELEVQDRYEDELPPLSRLLDRLADLLAQRGEGLLLLLDEVQSVEPAQLHEVTRHVQDLHRRGRKIGMVAAGVGSAVDELLEHPKTTFLRRASRIDLAGVSEGAAVEAIRRTVADTEKSITPGAAVLAGQISKGYPYLIQVVGALAWANVKDSPVIEVEDVEQVRDDAIGQMVKNVHRPSLRNLARRKMDYLTAMLDDEGPSAVSDIAARMGVDSGYQSVYRDRLIRDELVRSAGTGLVEYALPYLREALSDMRSGPRHQPGDDEVIRSRAARRRKS